MEYEANPGLNELRNMVSLKQFMPLENIKISDVFLMYSGGIEKNQGYEMDWRDNSHYYTRLAHTKKSGNRQLYKINAQEGDKGLQ